MSDLKCLIDEAFAFYKQLKRRESIYNELNEKSHHTTDNVHSINNLEWGTFFVPVTNQYEKNEISRAGDDDPQLETAGVAVEFEVRGLPWTVWLVPSAGDAELLGLRPGCWLTPEQLALLELLPPAERLRVLRWMHQCKATLASVELHSHATVGRVQ